MKWKTFVVLAGLFGFALSAAQADDWPQWLGPNRDSVWAENGIIDMFPDKGPKVLWKAKIAGGFRHDREPQTSSHKSDHRMNLTNMLDVTRQCFTADELRRYEIEEIARFQWSIHYEGLIMDIADIDDFLARQCVAGR